MPLLSRRRAWLPGILLLAAANAWGAQPAAPRPPTVEAGSAILVDAESGAVLLAQNADRRRPMASTTKIMTALLVLEHGGLDDRVTVSERAAQAGQSSVWLLAGEELTLGDLLKGILIRSGNDAAVAAAEHVAGSEREFVARMNARARELEARNTHFVNPHGLHHPGHYSTARDLALMAREAMRSPTFRSIVGRKTAVIPNSNEPWERLLRNHNKLLWRLPEADGIKTGFVKESGYCLVFSATRQDWQLIGVLLDSPERFEVATRLLDWGFANFRSLRFAGEGQRLGRVPARWGGRPVALVAEKGLSVVVPRADASEYRSEIVVFGLRAPIRRGEQVGRLELLRDGSPIEFVALRAGADVPQAGWVRALVWVTRGAGALLLIALVVRTASRISRRRMR